MKLSPASSCTWAEVILTGTWAEVILAGTLAKVILAGVLLLAGATSVDARPVPFRGAWSFMLEGDSGSQHLMAHYGLNRSFAPGVHFLRMEHEGTDAWGALGQANFLLKRWNGRRSQANLYTMWAAGGLNEGDELEGVGFGALQFDAEDRRWYGAIKVESLRSTGQVERDKLILRGGWAPYEADFDDLNLWFILQADYRFDDFETGWIFKPLVRMFNAFVLVEVGYEIDEGPVLNLMWQKRF